MTTDPWIGMPGGPDDPPLPVIEVDLAEAQTGIVRQVNLGGDVTVWVPPGVTDGAVLTTATGTQIRVSIRPTPAAAAVPSGAMPPGAIPPGPALRRRRSRLPILTSALLLVLLALIAIPFVLDRTGDNSADGKSDSVGGAASASPAPVPLTPEEYQATLTTLDKALATSLGNVTKARTPATTRNATDALSLLLDSEAEKLAGVTPPKPAAAAHAQLVAALDWMSTALAGADMKNICAGSSATPLISRQSAIDGIRRAAQALSTADPDHAYQVGTWLPETTKDPNRRLSNGRFIKRTSKSGSGQLKIKNNDDQDAVISVVPAKAKQPTVVVYVRGKQSFTVRGIKAGTYVLYVSNGIDWDSSAHTFSRACEFGRFDDTFKFTNTSTMYTIWEITLSAGSRGNASGSPVSPEDFPIN